MAYRMRSTSLAVKPTPRMTWMAFILASSCGSFMPRQTVRFCRTVLNGYSEYLLVHDADVLGGAAPALLAHVGHVDPIVTDAHQSHPRGWPG